VIIRGALPSDIFAMAEVTAASYAAGFADILGAEALAKRDAAFFRDRFRDAWPHMRVAEERGRLLGVTLVTDRHLDMLFVDPEVIGAGVGAALLADVEAHGAATLECFRDNHGARRFYERHGWRLADEYEREFIGCQRAFVAYGKGEGASARRPGS
jgi:putative acetyltransferase